MAHVQSAQVNTSGNSVTLAYASNVTEKNLLVCSVRMGAGTDNLVSVRDSLANKWRLARKQVSTGDHWLYLFYCGNCNSGPCTVTITATGTPTVRAVVLEYDNFVTTGATLDQVNSAAFSGSTTPDSGNITTTAATELIVCAASTNGDAEFTQGTNFTERQQVGTKTSVEDRAVSSTGTYSGSYTLSASSSGAILVASFMAGGSQLGVKNKTADAFSADATSFAATSSTPVSGRLYLVSVHNSKATTPNTPTVSGTNGYNTTWTQIQTVLYNTVAAGLYRITQFKGIASSGTAGVITADFAGVTQTGAVVIVDEVRGFNATTPISSNIATSNTDASASLTMIVSALASTLNASYAAMAHDIQTNVLELNDTILLNQNGHTAPAQRMGSFWDINNPNLYANQATGTNDWGGAAFEINETSVGGGATQNGELAFRSIATLAAAAGARRAAASALRGIATLSAGGGALRAAAAALLSLATFAGDAGARRAAASALRGIATLAADAGALRVAASALRGIATLSADAGAKRAAEAALLGIATLAGEASGAGALLAAEAALRGIATLSVDAGARRAAASALRSIATLSADAGVRRAAESALGSIAILNADAGALRSASAGLRGIATLAVEGSLLRAAEAALRGIATLAAQGLITKEGAAALTALATLTAEASMTRGGEGALTALATLAADAGVRRAADAALQGIAMLAAQGTLASASIPPLWTPLDLAGEVAWSALSRESGIAGQTLFPYNFPITWTDGVLSLWSRAVDATLDTWTAPSKEVGQ